jgi:putative membrane protein
VRHRLRLAAHFNWRALLLRFVLNAVALAVTVVIVPKVSFGGDHRILTWLAVSAAFGLLNAFVKPIVQFLMLPFLFVSYGFVVIAINSLMLILLSVIFRNRFQVSGLLMPFVGGAVFGLLSSVLENLLGLTPPITEGEPPGSRAPLAAAGAPKLESRLVSASERALEDHDARSSDGGAS